MPTPRLLTLIETMPAHLVGSHRAAGNWGDYPANGAVRAVVVCGAAVAADCYLAHNGYDHVMRPATAADVARYGILDEE
jgi:hypothetical protein